MAATKKGAKAAKKTTKASAKKASKKAAKKAARPAAASSSIGNVAHTEFVSADPAATKEWAKKTFSWKFPAPMKMPDGSEYHMFQTSPKQGGGIRGHTAPEMPGTLVYVEVANIKRAYEKALKNGAKEMLPPMVIAGGANGSMAIVHAPGGIAVGLWSAK